jgi:feruloyl-CoA synthase
MAACRELAGLGTTDAQARAVLAHPAVVSRFQSVFDELAREATGSSRFVARAILLDEPPSFDAREVTDKGSLNQKAVLRNRGALVEDLYSASPPDHVIVSRGSDAAPEVS